MYYIHYIMRFLKVQIVHISNSILSYLSYFVKGEDLYILV